MTSPAVDVGYIVNWRDPSGYVDYCWPEFYDLTQALSRAKTHALRWPEDVVWVETIHYTATAGCEDCDWTMPALDPADAARRGTMHRTVIIDALIDSAFTESSTP